MSDLLLLSTSRPFVSGRSPRAGGTRRRGMSLLEVMFATVIVLGSVMVLSRLAFLARRHAHNAEDRTLSQIHCQNIMDEILAGVRPLRAVTPTTFEGDNWVFMVDVQPIAETQLAEVAVTVDRLRDESGMLPHEDDMRGYRLVRWVRMGDRTLQMSDEPMGDAGEQPFEEPEPPGDNGLEEMGAGQRGTSGTR